MVSLVSVHGGGGSLFDIYVASLIFLWCQLGFRASTLVLFMDIDSCWFVQACVFFEALGNWVIFTKVCVAVVVVTLYMTKIYSWWVETSYISKAVRKGKYISYKVALLVSDMTQQL